MSITVYPRIIVQEPACSCGAKHWFQCKCYRGRIKYEFTGDPGRIMPNSEQIAYVRQLHPTADLIYIWQPPPPKVVD